MTRKALTVLAPLMVVMLAALLFLPYADAQKAVPEKTMGTAACYGCHDPVKQLHTMGKHVKVNCVNCHSASHMRFNRLTDLGFSEQQIKDELMFTAEKKVGQMMDISMSRSDAKSWFGTAPPDLSVIARSRGADWLYAFLRSFYRDPLNSNGWNNLVFQQVGMPHVLWQLQGEPVLDVREFKTRKEAEAAQTQVKSFSVVEEMAGNASGKASTRYALKSIKIEKPGVLSQPQYDETVRDLVNFLVWMSEPNQVFRKQVGIVVMFFCLILVLLTWFLYREFWKDVH